VVCRKCRRTVNGRKNAGETYREQKETETVQNENLNRQKLQRIKNGGGGSNGNNGEKREQTRRRTQNPKRQATSTHSTGAVRQAGARQ